MERLESLAAPANRWLFDIEMEQRPSLRLPRGAPQVEQALELWVGVRDEAIDLVLALENGSGLETAKYPKDAKGKTEPEAQMFKYASHDSTSMGVLTEAKL